MLLGFKDKDELKELPLEHIVGDAKETAFQYCKNEDEINEIAKAFDDAERLLMKSLKKDELEAKAKESIIGKFDKAVDDVKTFSDYEMNKIKDVFRKFMEVIEKSWKKLKSFVKVKSDKVKRKVELIKSIDVGEALENAEKTREEINYDVGSKVEEKAREGKERAKRSKAKEVNKDKSKGKEK